MNFKTTRRFNGISPLGEKNVTPDCNSKYYQNTCSDSNAPSLKQFTENSHFTNTVHPSKAKSSVMGNVDQFQHLPLSQINLELDNNLNEIIYLLGKRKSLTNSKKRKIREEMQDRLEKAKKGKGNLNNFQFLNDQDFLKVTQFCANTQIAITILGKVMNLIPEMRGPRADEKDKSQSFWMNNRELQTQMDTMLNKLKSIDKNLQKQNFEVNEICKKLDNIEDKLKTIVGVKGQDHLEQVQPLFKAKKTNYDSLTLKANDRQRIKDMKIEWIKKIQNVLNNLKRLRQSRLDEIAKFFGLDSVWDFEKYNFKDAGDFTVGFEELMKIKEKEGNVCIAQDQIIEEINNIAQDQEHIYNQLLRKQSDQAKAYHNYTKIMNQKIKFNSILHLFGDQKIFTYNASDLNKKFKDYKEFLVRFMEEDSLIKQGLVKTNETTQTFTTLLKTVENQKERRHQLLSLLETCIARRVDYEHKKEDMRNLMVQMTQNQQELTQNQEELEVILSDGDIDGYKHIGNMINKCQSERTRLHHMKERIEKDLEVMDRQVVGLASRIQDDYEDILSEIVPSDYQYSLKSGEDVKRLRNHLRKMYKRLGILKND